MKLKDAAIWSAMVLMISIGLYACSPVISEAADPENNAAESTKSLEVQPTSTELPPDTEVPVNTEAPAAAASHTPTATAPQGGSTCEDPFGGESFPFRAEYWELTDFCQHSVDYSEFLSGGPPPDGIPAINTPAFESVAEADEWIGANWPILFFENEGDARAYPLAILMWHEIVNDEVGGRPVSLTFCPLCNATIAFDRTLQDGTVLDFGTTGLLRNSDLVMYDRQTQSWWQQFTGEAIVGSYTGAVLEMLPSQIISWQDFADNHPDGKVLSRDTGYSRNYGLNPYVGYDDVNTNPFLFTGDLDGRLPATSRVVAIELNQVWKAYPFSTLSEAGVVNDSFGGEPVVVFWLGGTASALDARDFDAAKDVGSTSVFSRNLEGQRLEFTAVDGGFVDEQTGSTWNVFGEAVEGPLAGEKLDQIVSAEHFWFAWAAFRPDTVIWEP